MKCMSRLFKKLSQTKALLYTSDEHEKAFFEPIYRLKYLLGASSVDEGPIYTIYSSVLKLAILALIAAEVMYLITMNSQTPPPSLDNYIDSTNTTLIYLLGLYRYMNLISHKTVYYKLAAMMRSPNFDISTPKRRELFKYWRSSNEFYFKSLLILGTVTLSFWIFYPIVDDVDYNLVATVWIPLDYSNPTYFPITYAVVAVVFSVAAYFIMLIDLIMQSHFLHIVCQFTILCDCFEHMVSDCCQDFELHYFHVKDLDINYLHTSKVFIRIINTRLGNLVKQHEFLLRNTMRLRRAISIPMLIQMGLSTFLICCVGYQAATTASTAELSKFLVSILYLCYTLLQIFIFCRWGEEIKIQSERVAECAYFSGWERVALVPGLRARIQLVIARAARPVVLDAGGVYQLSLRCFTSIVKTSYSALSVLLSTQK